MSRLNTILGLTLSAIAVLGAIAGGLRWLEAHRQGERALCDRVEQLASTFVKYQPAETSSLYYPGAKECP